MKLTKIIPVCGALILIGGLWLLSKPLPLTLLPPREGLKRVQFLDRRGEALSRTNANEWNYQDVKSLHEIPSFLQLAFIQAEDRRFFEHPGVDLRAIAAAAALNAARLSFVRGGSTISEQVVRMIHRRERLPWNRLLEATEALRLERRFSKNEIFEFYLNQVPFSRNRRGAAAAARDLFDRDLQTLSKKEMIALAVLVRAPGKLDPRTPQGAVLIQSRLTKLAGRLLEIGALSEIEYSEVLNSGLELRRPSLDVDASHFLRFVSKDLSGEGRFFRTTLDASLQNRIAVLLGNRLRELVSRNVTSGAVLVVENNSKDILAWVSKSSGMSEAAIDAVTVPRQPGSTLKPFLYALALERGWTAATLIDDSPLARPAGTGLKTYRNYSGRNYGLLRLREALGNSLNIPAVRAAEFVEPANLHALLLSAGFKSLSKPSHFYGDGLALGNGEVTLFELTQAYAALASRGKFGPLQLSLGEQRKRQAESGFVSEEAAALIADILSDPSARELEFGYGNLLRFPVQTALKTGTSTDYRDAWAIGFTEHHTAGIWMGNLDGTPMKEITGSTGPGILLRSLFAELNRTVEQEHLYLSPKLIRRPICRTTGTAACGGCATVQEYFLPGRPPRTCELPEVTQQPPAIAISLPAPNLRLAKDPRIPDALEYFPFELSGQEKVAAVEWIVDSRPAGISHSGKFLWPVERGQHSVYAKVRLSDGQLTETRPVPFSVR